MRTTAGEHCNEQDQVRRTGWFGHNSEITAYCGIVATQTGDFTMREDNSHLN